MSHLRLPDTPSEGVDEVVKALQGAHAYPTRTVTAARLRRHFGPRVTVAQITAALVLADRGGYVDTSRDDPAKYKLTDDGHAHALNVRNSYSIVS